MLAGAVIALAGTQAHAGCSLSLVHCLDITASPGAYSLGTTLAPGTTVGSAEQVVTVESTASWGLRVRTDIASGRLTEWNGASYVASPKVLATPLQWGLTRIGAAAQTPSWTSFTGTNASVVSGQAANCLLNLVCGSTTIGITHRQSVTFADRRANPNSYRVQVTYEASHGW